MTKRIRKRPLEGQETADLSPASDTGIRSRKSRWKKSPEAQPSTSINVAERRAIDIAYTCDQLSAGVPLAHVMLLLSYRCELPIGQRHFYTYSILDAAEERMRAAGATRQFTEKESPNATA